MQPKVSMVVSCYNKVNYISEMLDSVIAQKWDNIEIILVNDGSNDGTRNVIAQYEGKLKVRGYEVIIWDQENQGVAAAVKNGLKLVTGEFVCIPDCDDLLHEEYVSAMVNALSQFPDVNCVVCDEVTNRWDIGFAPEINIPEIVLVPNQNQILLTKYMMRKLSTSVAVIMFRTTLISKLRLIEHFITHLSHTQEEQIWLPILALEKSIIHLRKTLYNYITRANSIITSQVNMEKIYQHAENRYQLSRDTLKYCMDSTKKFDFYCKISYFIKYELLIRRIRRNPQLKSYENDIINKFVQAVNDTGLLPCNISDNHVEKAGFTVTYFAISNYLTNYLPGKKATITTIRSTKGRLIAYGAGFAAKITLEDIMKCNITPTEVWDIKAQPGDRLFGIPLIPPDFDSLTMEDTVMIFLYGNQDVEYKLRQTESNVFYFQDVLNDLSAEYYPELIGKQVDY
ncbi:MULTISPECIES: glycosyltransferase family 2 protein [unclassified Paenibacillus]|uniref:glycosyltransferase family 2 protein n=1 Tax=unclassified Paenibacillus TaxID=185978 RepID=UPI002406071E|nr:MULTISPECIES: glycosyltransferase family 2 protein [unclassified Paenibacillus]MDF9843769.1 glycosyltransferase involved in cell wall biosynthesis [Paenibacillus sp. PastF-2]MDF9850392.1 glycosyltransferase involved in cell wall biosynthesis [Paenibacillus sp. PastM-2]MDF9856905.1 glycosyltransferase involved in cell wall biosynthesis [Paenibacillus sp. PastF-1]MDH6482238.1 glycosyltransferase involved in cell wall biosynthesis [Paenibacillus sp. PastH-2]MDH6509598.1 glycosyltransferase inv